MKKQLLLSCIAAALISTAAFAAEESAAPASGEVGGSIGKAVGGVVGGAAGAVGGVVEGTAKGTVEGAKEGADSLSGKADTKAGKAAGNVVGGTAGAVVDCLPGGIEFIAIPALFISFITDSDVIHKIMEHLDLWEEKVAEECHPGKDSQKNTTSRTTTDGLNTKNHL